MSETTELTVGSEKSTKKPRAATKKVSKSAKAKKSTKISTKGADSKTKVARKKTVDLEMFTTLQEQIAANQKELLDSISETFQHTLTIQLKRADRRRRWNNLLRDAIIILLALGLGFTVHLLYSIGYRIEGAALINTNEAINESATTIEPIKDDTWYLENYSYLFDQVKADLNADSISAYYLYSDDYKLNDIKPEYLLNMAYRQSTRHESDNPDGTLNTQPAASKNDIITVSASTLRNSFTELFGETAKFYAGNFSAGCLDFTYQRASENFEAKNQSCALNQHREIIEEIERIYQEGEVIYIISHAGIYDKDERSFYNFNDLFRPVAKDVEQSDFEDHENKLNRYQYQFKKSDDGKFYFNKIIKLN